MSNNLREVSTAEVRRSEANRTKLSLDPCRICVMHKSDFELPIWSLSSINIFVLFFSTLFPHLTSLLCTPLTKSSTPKTKCVHMKLRIGIQMPPPFLVICCLCQFLLSQSVRTFSTHIDFFFIDVVFASAMYI